MGPKGRREAGAERTGTEKQERKRENKMREEKTQCRWTRSRAAASGSCRDASVHPFLVLPCTDTSCITTSQALAGPAKGSRGGGMEERARPAPAGEGGEGRPVVEAVVQKGERWLAWFERQQKREGAAAHRPVPLPQYLFL